MLWSPGPERVWGPGSDGGSGGGAVQTGGAGYWSSGGKAAPALFDYTAPVHPRGSLLEARSTLCKDGSDGALRSKSYVRSPRPDTQRFSIPPPAPCFDFTFYTGSSSKCLMSTYFMPGTPQ